MRSGHKKRSANVFLLLTVVWMAVIFYMSAMQAPRSEGLSSGIARAGLKTFFPVYEKMETNEQYTLLTEADGTIRKAAHFAEYLLLGLFMGKTVFRAYPQNRVYAEERAFLRREACAAILLLFCFLYALSDEYHQMFVSGRSPRMLDVFIDALGAQAGIVIAEMIWTNKTTGLSADREA